MALNVNAPNPKAKLTFIVEDREGNIVEIDDDIVFTTVGKQETMDLMRGLGTAAAISHMALGNDDTTPSLSDTMLGNELYRETIDQHDRSGLTVTIITVVDYGEGNGAGSVTYKEAGWLNDAIAGELFVRATFAGKVKDNTVKWTLVLTITG